MSLSVWSKTKEEASAALREFSAEIRFGLSKPQKELHSKYLYDEVGSALFEAITHLPEYGLTRADARLLATHSDEIVSYLSAAALVIELGSGGGRKTRHVLKAVSKVQRDVKYCPIDVSKEALQHCARELSDIADVKPIFDTYLPGLDRALSQRRQGDVCLVLFLGSTIGNFERQSASAFVGQVRSRLRPGDLMLVGADLVKPIGQVAAAYDDAAGVTAAFNLNLLGRLNRELGSDFDLRGFQHEARYNAEERRIEMHLRSRQHQTVHFAFDDWGLEIRAGETIWTESSHKYTIAELRELANAGGFTVLCNWIDPEWPFAESLWAVQA